MKMMRKLAIYVQHSLSFAVIKMTKKLALEKTGNHQNKGNKAKYTIAIDQCYNQPPFFIELHAAGGHVTTL